MKLDPKRVGVSLLSMICWIIVSWANAEAQEITLRDDFESGTLSPIWTAKKMPASAFRFVATPTRTGKSAIEIRVAHGDKQEIGGDGQLTERAELREAPEVRMHMGMESWYAFSFFLPEDFPIVGTRLVIARWKQSFSDPSKDRSPMIALRYMDGKFMITVARNRGKRILYKEEADLRNRWVDMVFRILPIADQGGILEVWKNGRQIVDYAGALGYREDASEIYFKIGLYRDRMTVPMRIVYDRFRRGSSYDAVRPADTK